MKEQILKLISEGKSYREIQKILKCSRSLISYYVNPEGKIKKRDYQNKNRYIIRQQYKKQLGGKCSICKYDKCLDALHFHHTDPRTKRFEISKAIWGNVKVTELELQSEVQKCVLVCANCHAEIHALEYKN